MKSLKVTCPNPVGKMFGLVAPPYKDVTVTKDGYLDIDDSMTGYVRIEWDLMSDSASITLKPNEKMQPFPSKATVVHKSTTQVVFLAQHGLSEPYLYSYYPYKSIVIYSTHDDGVIGYDGGARVHSFIAKCHDF